VDNISLCKVGPRKVPSRDEKYMSLAFFIAKTFSKDPNTQIGSVIVGENNRPLGWGFNGPPRSINDNDLDWSRPQKYKFMVHSEINAIAHSQGDLTSATLYVTAMPCPRCMLEIAAYQIKKVVYFNYKADEGSTINCSTEEESKEIATTAGIELVKFEGKIYV